MPPQTYNPQPDYAAYSTPQPESTDRLFKYVLLGLSCLALIITAYVLVQAFTLRQATGLLVVRTDKQATLSLSQRGTQTVTVKAGTSKVRLQPGTYQLTATTDKAGSSRQVTVDKQKTTTVTLKLAESVPVSTVAKYSAQSIYAPSNDTLYFLNTQEDMPYEYQTTTGSGRPYISNVNNNAALYWITPSKLISESPDGIYTYINDDADTATTVAFDDVFVPASGISVNDKGHIAFVTDTRKVALADSPDTEARVIGEVANPDSLASVAPDGTVVTYTPNTFSGSADDVILYNASGAVIGGAQLGIVASVAWSPDSSKFSYASPDGLFVYDTKTKSSRQILSGLPSNPGSTFWVSASKLIYADNSTIWAYDLQENQAAKLATIEGILPTMNAFSMAPSGIVYFGTTADAAGKGGNLYSFSPEYHELPAAEQKETTETQQQGEQQDISYTGLNLLTENGVAEDQLANFQYAMSAFVRQQHEGTSAVSLNDISFVPGGNSRNAITFDIRLDNKKQFGARMELSGITVIRLVISDPVTNQELYDSGDVDSL